MNEIISMDVAGLRGPGLTEGDKGEFNAVAAQVLASTTLAGHYANGLADADIVGAKPGERSAQFWASIVAQRFILSDDPTYVAHITDGSDAQNVLVRFRRDTGAMDFVWGPALVAELAKADSAISQIAALAGNVQTIAGNAAIAALALRFTDSDDPTYVAHLVDGSPDQKVLARFRRDTGAMEFVYDELLSQVVQDVTTGVAGSRPSGAKLKGRFRRWGRAGGVTITDNLAADPSFTTRFTADPTDPSSPFTFYGGNPVVANGGLRIFRGPANSAYGQSCGRMAFMTDAPVAQVALNTGTLRTYRAYVDGRLESDEKQGFAAGGTNIHYPKIAFNGPRARGRRIDLEIILDGSFAVNDFTVAVPPGYRIWAVDTSQRLKIAIIGDSFTDGAGSSVNALAWAYELGRMLGGLDVDILAEGRGGTGYIARGPGPTDNSAATGYNNINTSGDPARLDGVAAWGPDIVIFALGTNDDGKPNAAADLKAAALYAYQQVRLRMPSVPIIVLGPWPATSGPSANKIAAENLIRAAVDQFADPACVFVPVCTASPKPLFYGTGYSGAKNGSGPSDWMIGGTTGTDPTHPTDDGHRAIAALIAEIIRPLLRLFTRY